MVNATHLGVLLKKDFLTLRRNVGFIIAFIVLPLGLMIAFIEIQGLVDNGSVPDGTSLIRNYTHYSSNLPLNFTTQQPISFMNIPFADEEVGFYLSTLRKCAGKNQAKYYFSKIAIISPDAKVRADAVEYFEKYVFPLNLIPSNWTAEPFETEDEAFNIVKTEQDQPFCFGVNFKKFDLENNEFEIQYSFNRDAIPDTNLAAYNEQIKTPDFDNWNKWFSSGVTGLYPFLTDFVARSKQGLPMDGAPALITNVGYAPMQAKAFQNISPLASQQLSMNFPFFFMIIYLIPFYYLTSKIASEKESKSREGMKMMGLNDSTYFLSWLILFGCIATLTSALITVCSIKIFENVNMFIFFSFCMLYSLTLYGWSFTIVAFLPTKRSSGIAATLFHIISYYLCFLIQDPSTPSSVQYGMSVFPNICMSQIVKQLFFYNLQTRDGLTWSTLSLVYQNYSFKGGLLMLVFDVVFWGLLGIYLDQVVPSQFGVAKPMFFCCQRRRARNMVTDEQRKRLLADDEIGDGESRNFEPVADVFKKQEQTGDCLKVRGLVKKFGPKTAVNNTNLTMYNGQIFALLGHNGAGKTTTISMLTGLIEATAGCAEVFNMDIFAQQDELRKILGVCPQHDVLFDFLTPEDHLRLFAAFKGTASNVIEDQVQKMLREIDLYEVRHQLSKTLSGGQKRKLSVAIAMIGNSKIVMLDEPTSGMDTSARRRLWDMLKKNKQGRIVILTTHYMDEADILGDRIAIMAEGKVQCTGSSLFLKNRYGVGYNLVIQKKDRSPAPQVDKFISERIDNAKKMQEVSSEISYQLPTESSGQFKQFFSDFDSSLDALNVRSYGVGITTLEEVFLKIGHGEEVEQEKQEKAIEAEKRVLNTGERQQEQELEEYSISNDEGNRGCGLFFIQMCAIMRKKVLMQVRDKKTLGIDTIFPVVLILVGLALSTVAIFKDGTARTQTATMYPKPLKLVQNSASAFSTQANIADFIQTQMVNGPYDGAFEADGVIDVDLQNPLDFNTTIRSFDEKIFESVDQNGKGPYWGQVYINSLNEPEAQAYQYGYSAFLMLNSTSQSVAGAWGATIHEILLRKHFADSGVQADGFKLTFSDQPFPLSQQFQGVVKAAAGTTSAILMTIAWMMISDSLVQNIIKERQKNIKHQIMVSGCSLTSYWMGNYVADIIFQTIPSVVGIIGVHAFDIDVPGVEWLFLITIFANPAFIYFYSFLFDKDETGSIVIKMVYFVLGIIAPLAISILQVVNDTTISIANVLRWFFYPFPIYSLTFGYMSISNRQIIQFVKKLDETPGSFDESVAGLSLVFLIAAIPFYWILVTFFEQKVFDVICCKRGNRNEDANPRQSMLRSHGASEVEDEDILEEHQRVVGAASDLPVKVKSIRKNFGSVQAVRKVSFGLEYGECFALLGVSGAGKTTVFKCLTGETYPSAGEITINGHDITTASGFQAARKLIGYCPQFDAIFEGLTVLEHLQIYADLKAITAYKDRLIEKAIKDMDLESYVDIRANNLSGGNKRKLSVAMAMLGNPPLVFLDEPSTGVDPQAKRFMWNIVSKISTIRKNSAVIITTHSMEEAEALCTKMGIMVAGRFRCFGSSQHIKNKYGTGYEIELKIRDLTEQEINERSRGKYQLSKNDCVDILNQTGDQDLIQELDDNGLGADFNEQFKNGLTVDAGEFLRWQNAEKFGQEALTFLEKKFKQLEVIEHYGSNWKLKVSRDNYSIGFLFGMMEDIQSQFNISEYSVTQTTLEQIFNNFAIEAEKLGGRERKRSVKRKSSVAKTTGN